MTRRPPFSTLQARLTDSLLFSYKTRMMPILVERHMKYVEAGVLTFGSPLYDDYDGAFDELG